MFRSALHNRASSALGLFALAGLGLLLCATLASAQNVGAYGQAHKPPPPSPTVLNDINITEAMQKAVLGKQLPIDGTFYDVKGQATTIRELLEGKPAILLPVYFRCPKLCNEMVTNLIESLRELPYEAGSDASGKRLKKYPGLVAGKDFNVILFSIDDHEHPLIATVRRDLFHKEYDGRDRETQGVHFITANPGQFSDPAQANTVILELTDAMQYKFYKADAKGREIQHPTAVLVLTPTGLVSSFNTGLYIAPQDLRQQLELAGAGKTGTTSGLSALACFLGDENPAGWYRFIMRVMGWLSVPVLGTAIFIVYRAKRLSRVEKKLDLNPNETTTSADATPSQD